MQDVWVAYGTMVAVVAGTMIWMDRRAVMRGQGTGVTAGSRKRPIPSWVDKLHRFFFFWCLVSPVCILVSKWLALPLMLYIPSYLDGTEKSGGRPSEFHRNFFLWFWFKRRMNLELATTCKFDPAQKYIFGLHPHGIIPWGAVINMITNVSDAKKKIGLDLHVMAASFCFYVPIYRDLLLGGGISDAARIYAEKFLAEGKSIAVFPGGATEALYARPGDNVIYIKKRKGFVHLALQSGAHLVPVYSFGENDSYGQLSENIPGVGWIKRRFQRIFGISLPLMTNIVPLKCKCTTVVGKPIPVEKDEHPSKEKVEALLAKYTAEVERLYEEHHERCLPGQKSNLVVI